MNVLRRVYCVAALGLLASLPILAQPLGYRIDTVAAPTSPQGRLGTDAALLFPIDVDFAPDGTMAFLDAGQVWGVGADGRLTLLAGTGAFGFSGDGGPAVQASFRSPDAIDFDSQGRLHIADTGNHRIRRVDADGTIRTVAGTGGEGFSGDGGPATEAMLNDPNGIAFSPQGDLFIIDNDNFRVRRVDASGRIETVFGNGESRPVPRGGEVAATSPLGRMRAIDIGPDGTVYLVHGLPFIFAVGEDGLLDRVVASDTGGFGIPLRVAIGADNTIYYTNGSQQVRRHNPDGSDERVAGNMDANFGETTAGFSGDGGPALQSLVDSPLGLDVDPDGALVFADNGNNRLRAVTNGVIDTVAGRARRTDDRSIADAELFTPVGVDVAPNGDLVVASFDKHALDRLVRGAGGLFTEVRTLAGDGLGQPGLTEDGRSAAGNPISRPQGLTFDSAGNLLFVEQGSDLIRILRPGGTLATFAGGGDETDADSTGPATALALNNPISIDVGDDGRALITQGANLVRIVDAGGVMRRLAGGGLSGFTGDRGPAEDAQLDGALQARFAPNGEIFISDSDNNAIRKIDLDGIITTVAGNGVAGFSGDGGPASIARLDRPVDMVFAPNGDLFVADQGNGRVRVLRGLAAAAPGQSTPATINTIAGGGTSRTSGILATQADLFAPTGLALDADGVIYISDTSDDTVKSLTPVTVLFTSEGLVHSASFAGGAVAAEQIVSLFGQGLADGLSIVTELPLPTTLAGTTVEVTDSAGDTRNASLFFVSPGQINMLIPAGTAPGRAMLTVRRGGNDYLSAEIQVAGVAPGLYSANASGQGVAAAQALRIAGDGTRTTEALFDASLAPIPLSLGPESDQVFLLLFGSGVRGFASSVEVTVGGASVPVLGAGPQGQFVGLDQINIGPLSRKLAGRGEVEIVMTVDGVVANAVTVTIQ